ncbi:PspC domain-containing protein [Calidifontibacillus erzurumensis]|uniref:PspC domain-containing protein n=1 Tax=Calidifontibacillus erzurumensis TaxID=2741433 RepID=A0A8J8KBE2_9BACI|nr:PspC domain-containing protein [Calidifontibacillus erzurumensis]NSL51834.1 PspC domain-containing protein [Calidifontibacillus erzurumensis]
MKKKLYRSRYNRKIAGILGGLGEYTGIDPTILRVLYVLLLIFTGAFPGIFIYIILAFIIPYDDGVIDG